MTDNAKELQILGKIIALFIFALLIMNLTACSSATGEVYFASTNPDSGRIHNPGEQIDDWQSALRFLEDGNKRYFENRSLKRDTNAEDRATFNEGQNPFAAILTCSDSRVSPEFYFDQKPGSIFVIRNAGNIADTTALGSLEFAVEHLKAPLVVVVGHSACGAVAGSFGGGEFSDNLQSILDAIKPAIEHSENVEDAILANISYAAERIKLNPVVMNMGAMVIGAHYDIETGDVVFFDNAE